MALLYEAAHHVSAHSPQPYHSKLHRLSSF
jgi:hypothetical protein